MPGITVLAAATRRGAAAYTPVPGGLRRRRIENAMPDEAPNGWKPRTIAAQALGLVEPTTKAVVPPLHLATTYVRDPDNPYRAGSAYGRPDNATARHAEAVLATLEEAHEAALFGSGMAAATAIVLALPAPSHIVASQVMYWAFRHWLASEAPRLGHRVDFVDSTDLAAMSAAIKPRLTSWSISRRPAIRCGPSATSPRSPRARTPRAPCWRS